MFNYQFTGEGDRFFMHLSHGPNVIVDRLKGEDVEGTTVLLQPGDVLHTAVPESHAELQPADDATKAAHASETALPTHKADLIALAEARGLDATGTIADLTARLTEPQE